jgi:hypothetical protein
VFSFRGTKVAKKTEEKLEMSAADSQIDARAFITGAAEEPTEDL